MTERIDNIARDFNTPGIPGSGEYKPEKVLWRRWGRQIERAVEAGLSNGGLIFDTKEHLDADLAHGANSSAWVVDDPDPANSGIYRKSGGSGSGSWSKVADLPYSFIALTDVGAGSPNAIQATSDIPLPSTPYKAILTLNVFEANTADGVTLSVNGATPKPMLSVDGSPVAEGTLTAGMGLQLVDDGSNFRILTDLASAGNLAAAEAARDKAREWADADEDQLVEDETGGDDGYSSFHWSKKSREWALSESLIGPTAGGNGTTDRSSKWHADRSETAQALSENSANLSQQYAADAAQVSGVNVPIYASVATAQGSTIAAGVKKIEVQYRAPTYTDPDTLVGGARFARMSLADITSAAYPASAYFRSTDRFMPDGTTDNTNGGYWVIIEGRPDPFMLGAAGDESTDDDGVVRAALLLASLRSRRFKVDTIDTVSNAEVAQRLIDGGVTSNPVISVADSTEFFKLAGRLKSVDGQGINDVASGASMIWTVGAEIDAASYGWLSDSGSDTGEVFVALSRIRSNRASGIELNSPDGQQRDRVILGNIISTGTGATTTGAGFGIGIAGVKGWLITDNLVLFSRQEGVHVEDEQRDGLLANGVWKCTLGHGAYLSRSALSAGQGDCDGFNVGNVSFKHASAVPEFLTTSSTSETIGTGSKVFTVDADKAFTPNVTVRIRSAANPTVDYMEGLVTSYSGTSLTVNVTAVGGTGTHSDWLIRPKREGRYGIYQVSAADGGLPWMTYSNVRVRGYEYGFNLGAGSGRLTATVSSAVAQDCDVAVNMTAGACYRGSILAADCPTLLRANNNTVIESLVSDTVPTTLLDYVGSTSNTGVEIKHLQFPKLLSHGGTGTETFDLMDMPTRLLAQVTLMLNNNNHTFRTSLTVAYDGTNFDIITNADTPSHIGNFSGATLINNSGKLALRVSSTTAVTAKPLVIDINGSIYSTKNLLPY